MQWGFVQYYLQVRNSVRKSRTEFKIFVGAPRYIKVVSGAHTTTPRSGRNREAVRSTRRIRYSGRYRPRLPPLLSLPPASPLHRFRGENLDVALSMGRKVGRSLERALCLARKLQRI